ncbi:cob(I)yrinic acid a,c-diamide adenosyltransferase [Evansella sp. AB-P1]|uniref:cob(I)yrinic acid a,c-diamide adenosyltransferase n=1 Tax=Evansella sp. AB-P1 TaxID=3037653 RepID=UPI00241D4381|nr:cob(I)yrinic acid a,c-diamide adenosyltransferase [Evansella sp. AB-P1]MDG5787646.1 cob(I)yrinic acid a,c-diamide adenosyltransferase [Evansella sp. AB-P1]
MKIYTKKGDKGETQLIGKRVSKTNERVEAYGTVDELNSFIGIVITYLEQEKFNDIRNDLLKIQHELFDLGGDLANVSLNHDWALKEEYVDYLEKRIDVYWNEAPPLNSFILPGGSKGAAYLHVCRTVTRRAERLVVQINDEFNLPSVGIKYLNRLSDYFFAVARAVNTRCNHQDINYKRNK